MSERAIVVTGASTGIGYAVAERFAKRGWKVFGSVRKAEDGQRLQSELGVTPLLFDVTDRDAIAAAAEQVASDLGGATLGGLVNNVGMSVAGPMAFMPLDTFRLQMEVNLTGPFLVTQAFLPLLGMDRSRAGSPGRISQISSVSGSIGFPMLGAYCASKHALNGMSESLRRELLPFGIEVSVVAPGAIITPIWGKGGLSDISQYRDTPYGASMNKFEDMMEKAGQGGLPVSRVADAVWHAITSPKPKLRYEVIPRRFREWTLPKFLPKRTVDKFIGKMMGFEAR